MKLGYAKHRYYRQNMIAKCCVCKKKKSLPYYLWVDIQIGEDFIAFQCSDCTNKEYAIAKSKKDQIEAKTPKP